MKNTEQLRMAEIGSAVLNAGDKIKQRMSRAGESEAKARAALISVLVESEFKTTYVRGQGEGVVERKVGQSTLTDAAMVACGLYGAQRRTLRMVETLAQAIWGLTGRPYEEREAIIAPVADYANMLHMFSTTESAAMMMRLNDVRWAYVEITAKGVGDSAIGLTTRICYPENAAGQAVSEVREGLIEL